MALEEVHILLIFCTQEFQGHWASQCYFRLRCKKNYYTVKEENKIHVIFYICGLFLFLHVELDGFYLYKISETF